MSSTTSARCRESAGAVADQLAAVDPTHATDYRSNAERYATQIHGHRGHPARHRGEHVGSAAIATEDIAQYLETAIGLTDKTPEGYLQGGRRGLRSRDRPISQPFSTRSNSHGVQVVLFNPQTDTAVTRRIVDAASTAGVPGRGGARNTACRNRFPDLAASYRRAVERRAATSRPSHAVNAPLVELSAARLSFGDRDAVGRSRPDRRRRRVRRDTRTEWLRQDVAVAGC